MKPSGRWVLALLLPLMAWMLCACHILPTAPSPPPIPWPSARLPLELPALHGDVLSANDVQNGVYLEVKTDGQSVDAYLDALKEQGYVIARYTNPEARKDDVLIQFEWHGKRQLGMKVATGQKPVEHPEGAVVEEGKLIITFRENPTTGFEWRLAICEEGVLRVVGDEYVSDEAPEGYTGVGGNHSYFFEAAGEGKTEVVFTLARGDDVFGKSVFSVITGKDSVLRADWIAEEQWE